MSSCTMHRRDVLKALALLPAALFAPALHAAVYPSRTVRVIVPYSAGGTIDMLARRLFRDVSAKLGQPFVIENRVGANGQIGTATVARAAPDGYTLLITGDTGFSIPSLVAKPPYDTLRDFTPVCMTDELSLLLVASNEFQPSSLAELKTHVLGGTTPAYGTVGVGSQPHLYMEQLSRSLGVKLLDVPFPGNAPMTTALISGEIQMALQGIAGALPYIQAGKLKAIAYGGAQRHALLPSVPTFAEQGVSGVEAKAWHGVFAPVGAPAGIVGLLTNTIWAIVSSKEYSEDFWVPNGFDPTPSIGPDKFAAFVANDRRRYEDILKELNFHRKD